ncbi:MAG TPA: sigma-70 family RNA polymerase sigma factor [Enhygromyxa sp.]|nr:sigma-70 family RNA polymerase sigma factor [Enhygromyxa sp.]
MTTEDSRTVPPDGQAGVASPSTSEEDALVDADEAAYEAKSNRRYRSKHESEEARAARDARDRRLVRRLKQGDERAFQELVHTYQDRIFGLVYRMIGNRQEAEDIAQEVFISVHRGIANYRGEGRFYTWLYRIASNTCKNRIKYLKGRNFHRASDIDETPAAHTQGEAGPVVALQSVVPGPEATVVGDRLERAIQYEIAQLEPEHRLLIVLRDIQGLSYAEILRITGLQEGTLKSRLHRARLALKARLEPYIE